jgi:hypothetical protein
MEGDVSRMGEIRNAYQNLVGKFEGKRSLGRLVRRGEGSIKLDLKEEIGCNVVD